MNHNQQIGRFGETLAKNYLVKRGYKIIDANVKLGYQELDLVAEKDDLIIFLEVKTRLCQIYGPAEDAFAYEKSQRFKKGIELYIKNKNIWADHIRADLIAVDINRLKKTARIKHFKDII